MAGLPEEVSGGEDGWGGGACEASVDHTWACVVLLGQNL